MDCDYSITSSHKKGKHLSFEERVIIQLRHQEKRSIRSIAREIGCSPTTVSNELKRGTVLMYHGKVQRYKASVGQKTYEQNRTSCGRHFDYLGKSAFISYVTDHFFNDDWSLDACVGRALAEKSFSRDEMVCTKTLYNYTDLGLLEIKNHHLPEKLHRRSSKSKPRNNKRKLGRSIEERPLEIETREEFGHWECDLMLRSKKKDDDFLLTMLERKSREYWMIPLANKEAETIMEAMKNLMKEYSEHYNEIFKTITTDNGSEFANLSEIEDIAQTLVNYAHPYTSCEKGSIERHNGINTAFSSERDTYRSVPVPAYC